MDVRQCRRCNKLFQYTGNVLCPPCLAEVDRQFTEVRDYIYENPRSSMEQICEATGVRPEDIRRWLREGRLVTDKNAAALLECEKCGKPIVTGRLCAECTSDVRGQLSSAARSMKPAEPAGGPANRLKNIKDAKMHIGNRQK